MAYLLPGSSSYNAFDYRIKKEQYDFYRRENITARAIGGAARGLGGGLSSLARGGGLTGLSTAINRELQRSIGSSGGSLFGNIVGGVISGKMMGAAKAVKAGATEESADAIGDAVEKGAAQGIGWGLIRAFSKVPGWGKLVAGAAAFGAADAKLMEAASKDVFSRGRTAAGVGASVGGYDAFKTTAGRYVEPQNFMGMMAQAKFDLTSDSI